jgi:hypothetical protein
MTEGKRIIGKPLKTQIPFKGQKSHVGIAEAAGFNVSEISGHE